MTRKVEIIIGADESWTKPVLSPHGEVLFAGADELIRCKDCKYYIWEIDTCNEQHSSAHNTVYEDDYCSRAERKEK